MNNMRRVDDLSVVFDKTWKANHNDTAKKGREREREFMNKMFDNKNRVVSDGSNSLDSLDKKISDVSYLQRQNRINEIMKKWR